MHKAAPRVPASPTRRRVLSRHAGEQLQSLLLTRAPEPTGSPPLSSCELGGLATSRSSTRSWRHRFTRPLTALSSLRLRRPTAPQPRSLGYLPSIFERFGPNTPDLGPTKSGRASRLRTLPQTQNSQPNRGSRETSGPGRFSRGLLDGRCSRNAPDVVGVRTNRNPGGRLVGQLLDECAAPAGSRSVSTAAGAPGGHRNDAACSDPQTTPRTPPPTVMLLVPVTDQTNRRRPNTVRPTVKTVAQLAGVSTTTVSRVLNGKTDELTEATRQRVHEAARALGYRPNSIAVGLRKQTTRMIGLMVPDIGNSYFHQLARGAEDTAMDAGYATIFCNTDRQPEKEVTYIDFLSDRRVDGIIFTGGGVNGDRHVAERLRPDAKVITIGPHRLPFPSVGVDDRAAIATAVRHLATQGCRDIACIGGTPGWLIHEERLEGFRSGMRDMGLRVHESLLWLTDLTHAAAKRAIDDAIKNRRRFDGLIAFSDVAAGGAMRALRAHGVSVPKDVAIVGCDDTTLATLVEPELSSIAFPLYEIGATATRMLIAMAEGETVEQHVEFPYELHVRAASERSPV